jgi:uncharacterized cupredoxin-like copper-binding protein
MRKIERFAKTVPAVAVGAALLLVTGCGGSGGDDGAKKAADSPKAETGSSAPTQAAKAPAGAIQVELGEYHFKPSTINTKTGKVTLYLVNTGVVPHDIVVNLPSGKKKSPQVEAGDKKAWEVGDLKAGTYKINCDLPGHTESGMVGKLIVK